MNAYETLGLSTASNKDQVVKAYRKLAQKYHPDREGGNEEMFKRVQAAYSQIEAANFVPPPPERTSQRPPGNAGPRRQWEPPRSPGNTWRDKDDIGSIFEEMKAANKAADRRGFQESNFGAGPSAEYHSPSETVARVSLREAFAGFNMLMPKRNRGGLIQNHTCHIPPGTPDGFRGKYNVTDGSIATVITRIETGPFHLRGLADSDMMSAGFRTGDIEREIEVDAIDLILGAWINTEDFLGERLRVRIPQGFNPGHRLKVAGKGYYGWLQEYGRPSNNRMDMFIKLVPVFKKPADIERQKAVDLYHAVLGGGVPDADN